MSDTISIVELVQIRQADHVTDGPDWVRKNIGATHAGFIVAGGNSYDYNNWACLMSNGAIVIYANEFIKLIAASYDAFARAGLWTTDGIIENPHWFHRYIYAFNEGTPLIYVKPDFDAGDDGCDIHVLDRAPHRDGMTNDIDAKRTWVIIASEYVSGKEVQAIRLSFLLEKLKDLGTPYKLGARGPEPK